MHRVLIKYSHLLLFAFCPMDVSFVPDGAESDAGATRVAGEWAGRRGTASPHPSVGVESVTTACVGFVSAAKPGIVGLCMTRPPV